MCELLGISVDPAATLGLYLRAFRPRAEKNSSGWGIAWFDRETGRPLVIKEPVRADESKCAAQLAEDPPTSSMFIVHVRAATVGDLTLDNTHPFVAEVDGRQWVFAHNGTVDLDGLDTAEYSAAGDTDSERAFHHLLARLDRLGPSPSDEAVEATVLVGAAELTRRGKANFLLTDGRTLYARYDGWKTLHLLQRAGADLGTVTAGDADYDLSLKVGDAPHERAAIVASVPLTDEPWEPLDPGTVLVIRAGEVVARHEGIAPRQAVPG